MIRVKILMGLWIILIAISLYSAVKGMIEGNMKEAYLFLAFVFVGGLMLALNSRRAKIYREKIREEEERRGKK